MVDEASALRFARLEAMELQQEGPRRGPFAGFADAVRELWRRRELLGLLIRRELRARYKDSSLGFVWSLGRPIAQLLVYFFVIGQIMRTAAGIPQFAVFVFTGLTLWSLFNEIVTGGTGSIVANAGLVKKVYLPREIFPLSTVGAGLVNFGIQFCVLLIGTIIAGSFPWSPRLAYVPVALLLVVVFGTATALLLSAVNVYMRDVQHIVEIVMMLLFWASPIIYSFGYVTDYLRGGWLEDLYLANPVTLAILAFQRGMWAAGADQPFPDHLPMRLGIALAVSALLLWVAQRVFSRLEGNFAQEL